MSSDLAAVAPNRHGGLVSLRSLRLEPPQGARRRRQAATTHRLGDLGGLFSTEAGAAGSRRRIRVCVVDTILQTGGAEWFATQLATLANPAVFEFMVVAFNSRGSALAERLKQADIKVICSTTWSRTGLGYDEWKEKVLFDLLERLTPDILFFSSQYLFDELPQDRLSDFPSVVRISNFHAEQLDQSDFSAAAQVVCCTQEQFDAVPAEHLYKATLINTGVNTELFRPADPAERDELKRRHGLEGRTVVLFVARLGDQLKRTPVFQEVVRALRAKRSDVAFVVVGYFESHNNEAEGAFRDFVAEEGVVWKQNVAPWEMPEVYRMADLLLSTSGPHEGLSNTVLQALASAVVPVVTPSAGMGELVDPGETGYLAKDGEAANIEAELGKALDLDEPTRRRLTGNGRRRVEDRFSLAQSAAEYQRRFLQLYRRHPAKVCVTDGYFGIGGAEWLAALLILNSDPAEIRFELVMHRAETALVRWLQDRGVTAREASAGMSYGDWMKQGMEGTFRRVRPDIVMPCTITTWPHHEPFYRLLVISQNASDAGVLTAEQYDQADYFLCVSEDVKSRLSPDHQWKMSVLHNSIDVGMFRPDPDAKRRVRERLGISPDAKVILWCGRLHEARKRVDVLEDVIATMADDEGVHYLIVGYFRGDEGDQDGWAEFIRSHRNISWVQDVWPWDAPEHYAAADVYLSTSGFKRSDFEGLSVATVQALAAALPVVTTMSGGQREVVEEGVNGRLVDTGDVRGLAEALRGILGSSPQDLEEMGRESRAKALEAFDISRHARLYTRIARLLKNNVGTALIADPELPGPPRAFRDGARVPSAQLRAASSFLTYTWPLIPEADDDDDRGAVQRVRLDGDVSAAALDQAASSLEAGRWLVVPDLGPDYSGEEREEHGAGAICSVLDHLESSFAHWLTVKRRGPDLIMEKR